MQIFNSKFEAVRRLRTRCRDLHVCKRVFKHRPRHPLRSDASPVKEKAPLNAGAVFIPLKAG